MRWPVLMCACVVAVYAGEAATAGRRVYYADGDGDGHGDPTIPRYAVTPTAGYTQHGDDCDDTDASVHPGADEVCSNTVDEDCDGNIQCAVSASDALLTIDNYRDELSHLFAYFQASAAVGDFDADGTADLAMGNYPNRADFGEAFILPGPARGDRVLGRGDMIRLAGTARYGYFGVTVAAGDVNGDGLDDLAVGEQTSGGRALALFAGPITADLIEHDADAFVVTRDLSGIQPSIDLDVVPDVDGDGLTDLVIGSRYGATGGLVFVQSGVTTGTVVLEDDATYVFEGVNARNAIWSQNVAIADATGDGIAEIGIASPVRDGVVYVVEGGIAPGSYDVDAVALATTPANEFQALAGADYDGDGLGDLVTGGWNPATPSYTAAAHCFLGPFSGALATSDASVTWESESLQVGHYGGTTGDVDGDGGVDVLFAAPDWVAYDDDAVFVQFGLASGVVDVASLVSLTAEGPNQSFGGFVWTIPDWTGDGGDEIAVGAYRALDDAGDASGSVYVFASDGLF